MLPASLHAASELAFYTDAEMVSVGDATTVTLRTNYGAIPIGATFVYTYDLPEAGTYVPNSFTWNGFGIPDNDPRLHITKTSVSLTLPSFPAGLNFYELELRAIGDIGDPVHHSATLGGNMFDLELRTHPTRIEDETATLIIPDAEADALISEKNPNFNHGASVFLATSINADDGMNSLLQFDLSNVGNVLPAGWEIQTAYLELYPQFVQGVGTLVARPILNSWVEGFMDGAPCIAGATWVSPNCADGWDPGGKVDNDVDEVFVDASMSYVELDLTSYVEGAVIAKSADFGIALSCNSGSLRTVLASREADSDSLLAPRLVVVAAPIDSYEEPVASVVEAEIVPTEVIAGIGNTRFEYWLQPRIEFGETGLNRVSITIPAEYQLQSVDTLMIGGFPYSPTENTPLSPFQYENWGTSSRIDLRFLPEITWLDGDPAITVILHAIPPVSPTPDRDFPSTVDNDRRGQPSMNAQEGDANNSSGPGDEDKWRVEATSTSLVRLEVTPTDTLLAVGYEAPYRAIAVFADSARIDVSRDASWTVTPPQLGSIDSLAVLSAQMAGSGVVTAEWSATTSNAATLTVDPASLVSLFVTPGSESTPVGNSVGFVATGIYSSGDSLDLTATATWTAFDSTVAVFTSPGTVLGLQAGSTILTASVPGFDAPAFLTVTPAELLRIDVVPSDTSVALGLEVPLQAIGTYTDSTTTDLTSIVAWNAMPFGIVDIGVNGEASTLNEGVASITASLNDVTSAAAICTVTAPTVVSLDGKPDDDSVTVQGFHAVRSWASYSDGDVIDKTAFVTWQSLDPAVADFVAPGTVEAYAPGVARLTHNLGAVWGDTLTVTVTPATLDSVVVTPSSLVLPPGTPYALTATGYWSNGDDQDVTAQASWVSDNLPIATVDSLGEVSTLADGFAMITASFGGQMGVCSLTVSITAFDSLVVTPSSTVTPVGLSKAHAAQAYRGGVPYDVTASCSWSTADTLVAVVDSLGNVTGLSVGATTLHAQLGSLMATPRSVQVTPAVTTSVEIQPAMTTLRLGTGKQLTAIAHTSDGQMLDVTNVATWVSLAPSIVYMQSDGLALGLSLGNCGITATYDAITSPPALLQVLPSVQLEALPVGDVLATPGTRDALLLSLRLTNHDVMTHELAALRVDVAGPADSLRLWLDDGDGIFDPTSDLLADAGVASAGRWTATNVSATLPVAGWKTVFLSTDVSLTDAAHGATIDAWVNGEADLFWDTPTATVAPAGFPLDSYGQVTSQDLVLSQIDFNVQPADTVFPGATEVVLLRFALPDDGGLDDTLTDITVRHVGSGDAIDDITALHLQVTQINTPSVPIPLKATQPLGDPTIDARGDMAAPTTDMGPWQSVATLVHTGANQWVASGLSLDVASDRTTIVRLVADVATSAREGRTLQLRLPTNALTYSSGRVGPLDSGWTNPQSTLIEAQHQLVIAQTVVTPPVNPISRNAEAQVVLGLELTAWAASDDALTQLTLNHISTGPRGPASDVDAQIESAQLILDVDGSGDVSLGDIQVASSVPGELVTGEIEFGTATPLNVSLPAAEPVRLLVQLELDADRVRDAEFLRVQLQNIAQVQTQGGLEVALPGPLQTLSPPQVDGQEAAGYDVQALEGTVLLAKATNALVMDLTLPANGIDDDTLQRLRIENLGDATVSDITRVRLVRDNGDGVPGDGDSLIANLQAAGTRAWEATSIGLPLPSSDPRRFWVTVDVASTPVSGRTFQASIPLAGIEVASGNDGPIDLELIGGDAHLISVQNRVTWLAGSATDETVAPDATNQTVLTLQAFNGYGNTRTLQSLDVAVRGTADEQEFQLWRLFSDENGDGQVDDGDVDLALASVANGRVLFQGFAWDMQPQLQQQLLVSYSLNADLARDASQIDAVIESENAFGYTETTQSIGSFELDSPGVDTVDGMIRSQIGNLSVPQRGLGGGETDVLTLDMVLPSNGWQGDTLTALQVQLAQTPPAAVYGVDIIDVELWQESDPGSPTAQFDPLQDTYVQRAVQSGNSLLFTNLNSLVPAGGQRYYVTVDMAASPTDSARVQLIVPADGVVMQSGNDGPLDGGLLDTAVHTVSSSDLLASLDVQPQLASVGQPVTVSVTIRNQGSVALDSVFVDPITVAPPGAAALVSGPSPAWLDLAPQTEGTIDYVFDMLAAGTVQFSAVARELSGPRQSDPASSPTVQVEDPPSGLSLDPLSSLPPSVNRGQNSVTPLVWQLTHPDSDPMAADILIDTVQLHVQNTGGTPQPASSVFSGLEIRTGGLVHADWDSIPSDSILTVPLDVPVTLTAGEQRDLPLTVSIAPDASASGFQMHLEGSGAVAAEDANSGQPVSLVANLPWSTQSATILTPATQIDVQTATLLPVGVNQGQNDIPGGSLTFVLPGAPGESEARVTALTIGFENNGAVVLGEDLVSRVRVRDGTTTLLDLQDIQSENDVLALPLSIPKVIVAGDTVQLDLSFDLLSGITETEFEVVVADSSAIEVRDANSGAPVAVQLTSGTFPWKQGPASVFNAAQLLDASAVSTAPGTTFPGAAQMPILELTLHNVDPPGSAPMRVESLAFEVLDEIGTPLLPTSVVTTSRWYTDGNLAATTSIASGQRMILTPATPFVLQPGETLDIALQVDLAAALGQPWIRFHIPSDALTVRDANDTQQLIAVTGMPTSTALIQVVAEATVVGFGVLEDPPTNVVPGALATPVLPLRIEHPGAANEADIDAQQLVVHLRDAVSNGLTTTEVATAATAVWDTLSFVAVADADSLTFDLSGLPPIVAGSGIDLSVRLDLASSIAVSDFRIAVGSTALRATSGSGQPLPVQVVGDLGLPYESPTVHVTAASLEASLAGYPNPFTPAQGPMHITFFLVADARVTCDVYTLSGERVTQLLAGVPLSQGLHDNLTWDGRNERGDMVRNGTYLLRIQVDGTGGGEFYRKLAVIR